MIIHIDLTAVVEVVSFLIFLWLLNLILYQPLMAIFRQRSERVDAGLHAAEESSRRADETRQAVERRLNAARVEAQAVIAAATKDASAQRQTLLEQARAQGESLVQQAQEEIRQERAVAVEALRREAVPLAILAASRIVGNSLDSEANRAVADRAIAEAGEMR